MAEILNPLILWLSLTFNIEIINTPQVMQLPSATLDRMFGSPVYALYDYNKEVIYIQSTIDLTSVWGKSILIHELVHHSQRESGEYLEFDCLVEGEKDAYNIQRRYLQDYEHPASEHPKFSPFNVLMRSLCDNSTM